VQTQSPVVIRQAPKTVIYATGMIYEKKNKTLTLLNKVRAHYEKPVTKATAAINTDSELAEPETLNAKTDSTKPSNSTKSSKTKSTDSLQSNKPDTNDARIRRRYE
jgi:lipopolysaccharide export system protein LptC